MALRYVPGAEENILQLCLPGKAVMTRFQLPQLKRHRAHSHYKNGVIGLDRPVLKVRPTLRRLSTPEKPRGGFRRKISETPHAADHMGTADGVLYRL